MISLNSRLLTFLFILAITSCNGLPFSTFSRAVIGSVDYYFPEELDLQEARDSSSYSMIAAGFKNSDEIILVLKDISDDTYHWVSGDNISIFTRKGQIVKTSGLAKTINYLRCDANIDLNQIHEDIPLTRNCIVDLGGPAAYSLVSKSEYAIKKDRVIEFINVESISWKYKNLYFYEDGKLVRGEYNIHPHLPILTLRFN